MSEIEKIICCDRGDNCNNSLLSMLAGRNAFGNDNNIIWLFFLLFAQRMWGNGWESNPAAQGIQSQMQDNQNANLIMDGIKGNAGAISQLAQNLRCDFNTLNSCCCEVKNAITAVSGQIGTSYERVIAAMERGDCNIISAVKDCCCSTQRQISDMAGDIRLQLCNQTNTLREGQRDLGQAISEGFSKVAFQAQQDKCDIIRAGQDNTQRVIDTLNTHWSNEQAREIQDLKGKISQMEQTQYLSNMIRNGNNCCGGCNNGCGC